MSSHGWFDDDLLPYSVFDVDIDPLAWFDDDLVGFDDQQRIDQSCAAWFDDDLLDLAWFDEDMDPLAWFGDDGGPDNFPELTALNLSMCFISPFEGSPFLGLSSAGASTTRRLAARVATAAAPLVGTAVNTRASADYSPTTLTSLNYTLGDTAGGGQSVVVTGTGLSGGTGTLGGNALTVTGSTSTTLTFTLPAHASGIVDLVINGVTMSSAFEYWDPTQVTGVSVHLDSNKGWSTGGGSVFWADQTGVVTFSQSVPANQPAKTASVFGSLPSIRCTAQQMLIATTGGPVNFLSGVSLFYVAAWTSTRATSTDVHNPPLNTMGGEFSAYIEFGANAGKIEIAVFDGTGTPAVFDGTTTTLNDGAPHLCGYTHDSGTSDLKIYLGATQEGSTHNSAYQTAAFIDDVGGGYTDLDGWTGDFGAIVMVSGVIAGGDLTKLNAWAKQRFGTP